MPSSATITAFYTFLPGTKLSSAKMNSNFDVFRGHLLSVDPNTTSASMNNLYDLGSESSRWNKAYVAKLDFSVTSTSALLLEMDTAGAYNFTANSTTGFKIAASGYTGVNTFPSSGDTLSASLTGLAATPIVMAGLTTPVAQTPTGDIAGSTCTIETNGRPVHISLVGNSSAGNIQVFNSTVSSRNIRVRWAIMRGSTTVAAIDSRVSYFANNWILPSTFIQAIDFPAAGTYNYYMKILNIDVLDLFGVTTTGAPIGNTTVIASGRLIAGEF